MGEITPTMLRISTRTWTRDSHDLFDYETQDIKQLTERHFASSHGLRLLRTNSTVTAVTSLTSVSDVFNNDREVDHLLTVASRRPGDFVLSPADRVPGQPLLPQRMWLVVRAMPNKRYALQEQDIIKLGRYRLRVRKIVKEDEIANFDVTTLLDAPVPEVSSPTADSGTLQCRICLSEGTDDEKLLCPCDCKGSIKYVHAECMRRWVHLRTAKDSKESDLPLKSTLLSEGTCELCKAQLPPYVRLDGELVPLVMMPDLSSRFILLENITPHANKGMHFISVPDSEFVRLGRGHDASVRIADVSISRNHATIFYEDGTFYLEDHDSKFGTLVALRRPVAITDSEPVAVQVGRSLIEFKIDPTQKFVLGCIDIPTVPDCFKFCHALDRKGIVSETRTPVMSISAMSTPISATSGNRVEELVMSSTEGDIHGTAFHHEDAYTVPGGAGNIVTLTPGGSRGLSVYLSENSPLNRDDDIYGHQGRRNYSPMFSRHQWESVYEDNTPSVARGSQAEEYSSIATSDGVAYLRLIMNTPPRNHILRNLRYQNNGHIFNRIITPSDMSYLRNGQSSQNSSAEPSPDENGSSQCFLPETAFLNLDGMREITQSQTTANAMERGRMEFTPTSEDIRGLIQWRQMSPNHGSTMQPPK